MPLVSLAYRNHKVLTRAAHPQARDHTLAESPARCEGQGTLEPPGSDRVFLTHRRVVMQASMVCGQHLPGKSGVTLMLGRG